MYFLLLRVQFFSFLFFFFPYMSLILPSLCCPISYQLPSPPSSSPTLASSSPSFPTTFVSLSHTRGRRKQRMKCRRVILLTTKPLSVKSTAHCCSVTSIGALRSKHNRISVPEPSFLTTLMSPPIYLLN